MHTVFTRVSHYCPARTRRQRHTNCGRNSTLCCAARYAIRTLKIISNQNNTRITIFYPGFLLYCFTALVFSLVMIYSVAPRYGRTNSLVYISICSVVGSVSVMAIKGFGVAVKLTIAGNNQFTHPSTYVFGIVVATCILVQMNYFNKALDTFSTNVYVSNMTGGSLTDTYESLQCQSIVLCRILNRNYHRICYFIPRFQYRQSCKLDIPSRRLYNHLPWSTSSRNIAEEQCASQRSFSTRKWTHESSSKYLRKDVCRWVEWCGYS